MTKTYRIPVGSAAPPRLMLACRAKALAKAGNRAPARDRKECRL